MVHRPPQMLTFSVESLDKFVTETETHLAAQKLCPIHMWITMNSNVWETMRWSFDAKGLIAGGVEEFKDLLKDTPKFLEKQENICSRAEL